jgi:hypothetical protein
MQEPNMRKITAADFAESEGAPDWFYIIMIAAIIAAWIWTSNQDYKYYRSLECLKAGAHYDGKQDLCVLQKPPTT